MDILIIDNLDSGGIAMNLERINSIVNNEEKVDIYYNHRPVWIQEIDYNNQKAKVGFIDNFEESNVLIKDLYE